MMKPPLLARGEGAQKEGRPSFPLTILLPSLSLLMPLSHKVFGKKKPFQSKQSTYHGTDSEQHLVLAWQVLPASDFL